MNENFADAPVSVAERKAEKDADGTKWGARDALVKLLRAIDRGELKTEDLVVAYTYREDGETLTGYSCASTGGRLQTLGLLAHVQLMIGLE